MACRRRPGLKARQFATHGAADKRLAAVLTLLRSQVEWGWTDAAGAGGNDESEIRRYGLLQLGGWMVALNDVPYSGSPKTAKRACGKRRD